jgi:hypothetical protein
MRGNLPLNLKGRAADVMARDTSSFQVLFQHRSRTHLVTTIERFSYCSAVYFELASFRIGDVEVGSGISTNILVLPCLDP